MLFYIQPCTLVTYIAHSFFTEGRGVSNLVFYAQSTTAVILGRKGEEPPVCGY